MNAFLCLYIELNWVFFKKKWVKRTENNEDNREIVNPSFVLGHPLQSIPSQIFFSQKNNPVLKGSRKSRPLGLQRYKDFGKETKKNS